jgi:hypothetical protein
VGVGGGVLRLASVLRLMVRATVREDKLVLFFTMLPSANALSIISKHHIANTISHCCWRAGRGTQLLALTMLPCICLQLTLVLQVPFFK